jgi:DNA-binding NarL/FixJ family response regulator
VTTPARRVRVLCVDDHRLVLDGVALIIGRQKDLEVVGQATSGEEGVRLFAALKPDVVLMDLQLPVMSGLEAIRAMRRQDETARIVVLTMYSGDEDTFRALEAGAVTYLLKDTLSDDLIRVIREVYSGTHSLRSDLRSRLADRAARPTLTPREVQVVELISLGLRNKEVAASLGISEETVQVHVRSVLTKLDVSDRTAAVHVALQRGIIHLR